MVDIHNGILALKKKEMLSYATTWVNLEDFILSEINVSHKTQIEYDSTLICEVTKVVKLLETKGRIVVTMG